MLRITSYDLRVMDTETDIRKGKPSASGMQRLVLCPGSWLAEKGCPDVGREAAELGTRLHKHMELGTTPDDPEEAEAVEWCRRMELQLAEKYVGCPSTPDERTASGYAEAPALRSSAPTVLREVRWWGHNEAFSGQADVVFVHEGCALVLDYKFGRVPVAAARDNMQLAALAYLALRNLPDVDVVFCGILQPLAGRQEPRLVRYHREMKGQLEGFFMQSVEKAAKPHALRVPGENQCRYCKAKAECPACNGLVVQQTQVDVAAAWLEWSPEKKAEAVRVAALAKKWAEAVERKAKGDLKEGLSIPGCSLSAGRKSFKVTDAQGAFSVLADAIGVTGEEFASCCSVKISELDKLVHKRLAEQAPEGTKQLVKASSAWVREKLAGVGSVSTSEPSLKVE